MATFPIGHWTRKVHERNQRHTDTSSSVSTIPAKITWHVTAGNEHTLRGIPAIGRGVQGAIPGTNPSNIRHA